MKIIFISLILLILSTLIIIQGKAQDRSKFRIESAVAYTNFHKGGSTSVVKYNSKAIDTISSVVKINIKQADLDTLGMILTKAKAKKHYQQKIGPCYYLKVIIEQVSHRMVLVSDAKIIDLTEGREFFLNSQKDIDFIKGFIYRNKL